MHPRHLALDPLEEVFNLTPDALHARFLQHAPALATEAAQGALAWARNDWRRKVVVAGHFADNPASGQVLCKSGFLYTGDVELRPSAARGQTVPTRMMVWLA